MAIIQSGNTSALLVVDENSKAARTTMYNSLGNEITKLENETRTANDSFVIMGGVNDDNYRVARMDRLGGAAMALNNVLFYEPFEGTVVSAPTRIALATTTFTQAQTAAGGLNMNSGNSLAASAAALLTTNKRFIKLQRAPLHTKIRARIGHVTNVTVELGFGNPGSQTTAPTVGAYWQVSTGGVVQPVLTFNSIPIIGDTITMPGGWQNNFYTWDVVLEDDEVRFFIQDTASGLIIANTKIRLPLTQTRLWDASRLSVFARIHNVTAPASAPVFLISSIDVVMLDAFMNKPWSQTAAMMGLGSETVPTTMAQAANFVNSTGPTSGTLSNTAAGYTTLGGQFQFAAVAGSEVDYALFGFTVPSPYSFIATGIDISTFNMGAAVATTPTLLQWFASPDQLAISLATSTNRRIALGSQVLPIATPIGGMADRDVVRDFSISPLVTNPGRILVVGFKMPVATATASQIVRGTVAIRGYFE